LADSPDTTASNPTRELAAIMFSDISGYTAMMGRDEAAGLDARNSHRELLRAILPRFNGRLIGDLGDGALSSFHSAIEAVNCARALQSATGSDGLMALHIGIHVGDVLFSENTVLGDGVNVASRIVALAPAGKICISDRVYEDVRNHRGISATSLGQKHLKNVDRPIGVYVLDDGPATVTMAGMTPILSARRLASQVLAVIEDLRIGHVIGVETVGLDQKKIFRVADVRAQSRRHRRHRLEHRGENPLPCLDYRIVGIGHVKIGAAGVRIDHHLDRIADVVDPVGVALRVGVVIAERVAVNDPHHSAVQHHCVGVAIAIQEWRDVRERRVVEAIRFGTSLTGAARV
jgi:class 3 adenylate cyclase